jgi:hypothetical protein
LWPEAGPGKVKPEKRTPEDRSQAQLSPVEMVQQLAKLLFAGHRTLDKKRVALQWGVRNGDNRLAYIFTLQELA